MAPKREKDSNKRKTDVEGLRAKISGRRRGVEAAAESTTNYLSIQLRSPNLILGGAINPNTDA